MSPAQEQYLRMKRYFTRMKDKGAADEATDDMYSFFMHAWHLCDWVCHDPTLRIHPGLNDEQRLKQIQMKDVSDLIRLCGNVADRTKHLQLRDTNRMLPAVTRKNISITPGSGLPAQADYLFEFPDGSKKDALDFAHEVVKDWERLLLHYGVSL